MTDKDTFKEFLQSKPVAYYPDFAAISGSTNAGVLLSQLFYWKDKESDPDGWIYKTQKDWQTEIYLTRNEQETARKKLRENGILQERLKGNPAKLYYKIDFDVIIERLKVLYESRQQDAGTQHAETSHTKVAGIAHTSMQGISKPSLQKLHSETTTDNGIGWSLADKGLKPTKTPKEPKAKKARDFSAIEPVLKILKEQDKHAEKAISKNTKRLIENAMEEYGVGFVQCAVRGRMHQARIDGKPLYLNTFFDPDNAEWRADCAKVGEQIFNAAESLKMASEGDSQEDQAAFDNLHRLMAEAN